MAFHRVVIVKMLRAGLVMAVILGLSLFDDAVNDLLRFDREGLASGQIWRLFSGHVVHLGLGHAVLNVAAVALIAALFGSLFTAFGWLLVAVATTAAIDAGLWWFSPHVTWYVGLSGALHGALAAAGTELAMRRQLMGVVLLACLTAKLAWEQLVGPLPGSGSLVSGRIVTEAHLYGAVGGLVAALLLRASSRRAPL